MLRFPLSPQFSTPAGDQIVPYPLETVDFLLFRLAPVSESVHGAGGTRSRCQEFGFRILHTRQRTTALETYTKTAAARVLTGLGDDAYSSHPYLA
jgi:hypothetical protein